MTWLPRLHLFEWEDQPWFPATLRDSMTDYLRFVERRSNIYGGATARLGEALQASGAERIVDLCSGGGGPLPELLGPLAAQGYKPQVTLTDLYPNQAAFEQTQAQHPGQVGFSLESVNATAVPASLTGLRTMFSAIHHFRPEGVRAVLADAVKAEAPVAFFDVADRRLVSLIGMLFVPWIAMLVTPLLRPVTLARLVFTYILPVLPWAIGWDGFVSMLRGHTPEELLALAKEADPEGRYSWEAGTDAAPKGPGRVTWLTGRRSG